LEPVTRLDTPDDVQGGMLAGYDEVTHACLVLLAVDDAKAGAALLADMSRLVTTARGSRGALFEANATGSPTHPGDGPFYNVAFTFEGWRRLGLSEAELTAWLPQEFREGMEARASILGDFRANHPHRWPLPRTNWNPPAGGAIQVQMSAVHMVVQIRAKAHDPDLVDDPSDERYPLRDHINTIVAPKGVRRAGLQVIGVQPMRRMRNPSKRIIEHFGFVDGEGQPEFTAPTGPVVYPNQVQLGELLLGHANQVDPAPVAYTTEEAARLDFLRNGSFMVVRKLRQDVHRLRKAV